ncbi:hypothetical protein VTJ49DRAFT_1547 [Mycothermus thermophilus]|uniref:Increased loss of mitochondrial DNA protein 1 n=1 Tax=Humicola insolens TaxID=85995 RepID=A0ABR3VP71_HUMIN
MALISAKTILTSLCLFHLTLGFFFLTRPASVAEQPLVYVLGESMGLPGSRAFEQPSPALGLLAAVLALVGLSDLATLSLPDEVGLVQYWGMQAPLRLTITFSLALYSFFFSPSSPLFYSSRPDETSSSSPLTHPTVHRAQHNPAYSPSGWGGDALKNRVFFSFMFVEAISWFWAWVTLQEERREVLAKRERRRRRSSEGGGAYQY